MSRALGVTAWFAWTSKAESSLLETFEETASFCKIQSEKALTEA